jgi:hypothetical protein
MNREFDKLAKDLAQSVNRRSLLLFGWLLLATPVAIQAQFTYTTNNGTITITGYTGTDANVVIPSTIDGLPVTSIGVDTFLYSSISGVTIPNSVTNIEDGAFEACFSLTNIMVDPLNSAFSSVDGVLFNQSQTTLVEYPGGNLGGYTIPNSVTNIEADAFSGCSLSSVTIPNSVSSIGDYAFYACTSLTNIMLDPLNSAFRIVDGVLFNQSQTTLVEYPVGKLGGSYVIPNGVTSIGAGAFYGSRITGVTIPNSVTNIGAWGFNDCSSLGSVTIPNSVINIGDGAFASCNLANLTLGSSVTGIGAEAFAGCRWLTHVTIPNSVTSIGGGAFIDCSGLANLTLGSGLTSIGAEAFDRCYRLTSVTIPNSVTSIGNYAFNDCTSLTSLYFQGNAPAGVIGTNVFSGDWATIYYLPGTTGWGSTFGGIPTAFWTLPYPLILNSSLGIQSNGFGFTVSWATNASVVVEASDDLKNPSWSPVQTNALNNGVVNFTDPQWTNYPSRFYRVRSQ